MELLLIRHALPERVENEGGIPADPQLSEEGRWQARRLADWLRREAIDALFSSPLRRARQTSLPLAEELGLEVRLEPGVVEWDQYSESYIPVEELKTEFPEQWAALARGEVRPDFDIFAFQRGVVECLERIIGGSSGKRVAVVCHGGVINAWSAHVLGLERPIFFLPAYTSISRYLAASSGERSVKSLNETAHLRR